MTRLVQHSTNSPRRSLSFDSDDEEDKPSRKQQEKKVKEELADLNKSKLQKLCRKNHLKDGGNEKQLRTRLTKKMMEDFDSDDADDDSDDDSSDSGGKTKKSVEKKYRAMSVKKLRKACEDAWTLDTDGDK